MKTRITEEQLVELAKKAKPVPVLPEQQTDNKNELSASVLQFINDIGIKRGRNEVPVNSLFEAYAMHSDSHVNLNYFQISMGKLLKRISGNFKVNMKIITIVEKVKEFKDEQKKEIKVSRTE